MSKVKLKGTDIFAISRIVKKLGINVKEIVKEYSEVQKQSAKISKGVPYKELSEDKQAQVNALSMQMIDLGVNEIFVKLENAEEDIIKLMAKATSQTVDQIKDLDMDEFIEIIKGIITNEGFSKSLSMFTK
jgi:hypothetical protein